MFLALILYLAQSPLLAVDMAVTSQELTQQQIQMAVTEVLVVVAEQTLLEQRLELLALEPLIKDMPVV
jgi:hypothetical protein